MGFLEMNKRASLAHSGRGEERAKTLRLFPQAKIDSEVIGAFDHLGGGAQRFEMVSQDGQISVRPWLPATSEIALALSEPAEIEEQLAA